MQNRLFLLLSLFIIESHVRAQSLAIDTDASVADASAILDVKSEAKGVLCPRMTKSQRLSINLTAKSLLVFQTEGQEGYYYNSGTDISPAWVKISAEKSTVAFSATSSAAQSYGANVYTKILFPTEEYDESNNFVLGATSEFTARKQASIILMP